MHTKFWLEILKGTDYSDDLGVYVWTIFEEIVKMDISLVSAPFNL